MEALFVSPKNDVMKSSGSRDIEVFSCTGDDNVWMGHEPLTAISLMLDALRALRGQQNSCPPEIAGQREPELWLFKDARRFCALSQMVPNSPFGQVWFLSCNSRTPCPIDMKFDMQVETSWGITKI